MFDWVSIENYSFYHYMVMLLVVSLTLVELRVKTRILGDEYEYPNLKVLEVFLFFFVLLYMGTRPINSVFVDMTSYAHTFELYQFGRTVTFENRDFVFELFMQFCAKVMDVRVFFFMCGCLYTIPLYLACKKWFKNYSFYAFLMLVISFSFWAYGTNGIRNGIATSLFIFAISREKSQYLFLWLLIAVSIHKSMIIPIVAYVFARYYHNPQKLLYIWFLSIVLSLLFGSFWENLFIGFSFDDRVDYLTSADVEFEDGASSGFRWDFLLYSSLPILIGWITMVKANYRNQFYKIIYATYVFSNIFWILIMRANFTNRFAYLSWFLMAIVIIYPFLTDRELKRQYIWIGYIILGYFSFTFIMNIFVY